MEPKKTKVLLAITKSNFGGAQRYVFNIASLIDKNRFDITVLSGGKGLLQEKLRANNIKNIVIPRMARDVNLLDEISVFFSILSTLKKERPDVFHVNSSKMGGLGALAGRIAGVPHIIFTVHGWYFNEDRLLYIKIITYLLSWVTALLSHTVITVSDKDREQGARMPFIKNKLIVCYPGIPDETPLPRNKARLALTPKAEEHANDFWLGTIAEFTKNKNIPEMVKAVISYNKKHTPKIFFSLIGEHGEEKALVEALIRKEKAEDYITILGYRDNAPLLLRGYDGFILASKKEGFPTVLLEAGRAGLPVLASPVGGIPELIEDNKTGILLTGLTAKEIEIGLEKLITNTDPLGKNLAEKVATSFSLLIMMKHTEVIYKDATLN